MSPLRHGPLHRASAALVLGLLLAMCAAQPTPPPPKMHPKRVIVQWKQDRVHAESVGALGLAYSHTVGSVQATVFTIKDGKSVPEKVAELNAMPSVLYAEPDWKVHAARLPNDTLIGRQWYLPHISAFEAWNITTGSPSVKVCVLDSGVQRNHPDLRENILPGGWNFVPEDQTDPDGPPPRRDSPQFKNIEDGTPISHGTHVSGTIAAVGNNARGVIGVAHTVKLLICRFLWDNDDGNMSDAATCLSLCRGEGAMLVAGAWGGVHGPIDKDLSFLAKEYQVAADAGQLIVMAAGNGGYDMDVEPVYPASFTVDNMITVGATDQYDAVASYSNYGSEVHVTAPGSSILSTVRFGQYGVSSGTSMATPVVTAAAALVQSVAAEAGAPSLTYTEIKAIILGSTDPPSEWDVGKSQHGRLNLSRALTTIRDQLMTTPVTRSVSVGARSCEGWAAAPCVAAAACNKYQGIIAINDPSWGAPDRGCNASSSYRVVAQACLWQRTCNVPASKDAFLPDPCPGAVKTLSFTYTCGPLPALPPQPPPSPAPPPPSPPPRRRKSPPPPRRRKSPPPPLPSPPKRKGARSPPPVQPRKGLK